MDVYGMNLENVRAALEKAGVRAEIRGDGTARFVFSRTRDRAVEISWAGDEGIFVEYWMGSEQDSPVREEFVGSFDIAVKNAMNWHLNE